MENVYSYRAIVTDKKWRLVSDGSHLYYYKPSQRTTMIQWNGMKSHWRTGRVISQSSLSRTVSNLQLSQINLITNGKRWVNACRDKMQTFCVSKTEHRQFKKPSNGWRIYSTNETKPKRSERQKREKEERKTQFIHLWQLGAPQRQATFVESSSRSKW